MIGIITVLVGTDQLFDFFQVFRSKGVHINSYRCHVLLEILRLGGECGNEDLVKTTYQTAAGVSVQLKKLEEQGYVVRFKDEEDYKRRRVRLTNQGEEFCAELLKSLQNIETMVEGGFTEEEIKRFLSKLIMCYDSLRPGEEIRREDPEGWPEILRYLHFISRCLLAHAAEYDKTDTLNQNQRYVLMQLYKSEEFVNYKSVEKALAMKQQNVQRIIVSLEEQGYVVTKMSEHDRRIRLAMLTDAGRRATEPFFDRTLQFEKRCVQGMNEEEIAEFSDYLNRVWDLFFEGVY